MKNFTKILFGANLLLAAILLTAIYGLKKGDSLKLEPRSSAGVVNKVRTQGIDGQSDLFCAILLIPKPLLPVVKQMSRHKIAKGIKLLPANMEWYQGNLVASSKETFVKKSHSQTERRERVFGVPDKGDSKSPAEFKKRLRAAALLSFLAQETKTKFWQKSIRQMD